ncbi:MAG TPA: cytochrome c oxidase subunit II [Longimicrobiales bacterium]|nr:cytochrome c oxidase subunit II [Longimicrobiales bacterium]
MKTRWPRALAIAALAFVLPLLTACGEYPQTTFSPVSDFGEEVNQLFWWVFWWTMGILVVVQVLLIYILFRYRGRPGAPKPKPVYGHTGLEIVWTLIPALIIVFIAVPTIRSVFATQAPAPPNALTVEVIGRQFWWEFRYPELNGLVTANQLHVPVDRPIELRMRSTDVIHSFWIPRLGGKRDVAPAPRRIDPQDLRTTRIVFTPSETGEFLGECAEFCGQSHAFMRMLAVVMPQQDFAAWAQSMTTSPEPAPGSLEAQGRDIFMSSTCIACHAINGTNAVGQLGPNLTGFGNRWAVGAGALPNTRENVVAWIKNPAAIKPGARMPGTQTEGGGIPPTGLTDEQVEAVAAYLLSLR